MATKKGNTRSTRAAKKSAAARKQALSHTARKATSARGAARAASRATGANAIQLLRADHATVRELLSRLEATTARGTRQREELLARIQRELEAHTRIEEEIFYPAFKEAGSRGEDDKLYFEAIEEHRAAGDMVLPDLLGTDPQSECFSGRAKVLKELVEHHAREEEREMFPRARQLLSAAQLRELGERMQERKRALLAQPAAPNSVTGRVLAAVAGAVLPAVSDDEGDDDAPSIGEARSRRPDGRDGGRAPRATR